MPRIRFAVQSYVSRSLPLSAQRLVNLYAEQAPEDAKTPVALFGTPGLKRWATIGDGPIRGMIVMGETLYVVSGDKVYSVAANGSKSAIGTIPGTGLVDLAHNGTQIFVRTGNGANDSYIVTASSVTQITDDGFPGASSVTYQDGYFIFSVPDSDQFGISALDDGLSYDATDFATAEGDPDGLFRAFSDHRELWLFGYRTIEIWFNSGAADFPFERASGAFVERGLLAPRAVAKVDNTVFWPGEDRIVYRADAYTPIRISTHGIEALLEQYEDLSDLIGWTYTQDGHVFYVLKKPGAFTVVYDVATGLWHNRQSWEREDWRVSTYALAYGKHLVGDDTDGRVYELDLNTYDEDGDPLVATAVSPAIWAETNRATMSRFQVDLEAGVGLTTGQGSNPQAMLDWSDDGGKTFGNQLWAEIGEIGEYGQQVEWRRLGQFRQRVMRVSISDPVKRVIFGAYADIQEGRP